MLIKQLHNLDDTALEQLCDILVATVDDGASVGFLPPLARAEARAFWEGVLRPGVLLWVAAADGVIQGTVQLHLVQKPNGLHRAEVVKLLVHPGARRQGIARRLMAVLEEEAGRLQRTLLVLDTREGDPSNLLYRSLGYREAGRIPFFARAGNGALDTTVVYYKVLSRGRTE